MNSTQGQSSEGWPFLGMLIHDMNNSLSALGMGLEFLKFSAFQKLSANDRKCFQKIDLAYCDLRSMVADAADLRKLIKGAVKLSMEDADLSGIVKDTVRAIANTDPESAREISVSVPSYPAAALVDKVLIERVVYCFLSVAIRHTPINGSIKAKVSVNKARNLLKFSVSFQGVRLPSEYLKTIFSMPCDANNGNVIKPGGASIIFSRHVIEKHGGSVLARSHRSGNTLIFTIPRHP